jgi:hypothetical protein
MRRSLRISGALAAAVLVLGAAASAAQALMTKPHIKCIEQIGKAGGKFVSKALKAKQKCRDSSLNSIPGDECLVGEPAATIATLQAALTETINKYCGAFGVAELGPTEMQFPGKCPDLNVADSFTAADLEYCERTSHTAIVDELVEAEYGGITGDLVKEVFKCQQAISKNGAKFTNAKLKAVQKCRNGVNNGTIVGIAGLSCATNDPTSKTQVAIEKAESKARAQIFKKCPDPLVDSLDVCPGACVGGTNDGQPCTVASECPGGSCGASTEAGAEDCIIKSHGDAADNPSPSAATLIDFEYTKQAVCGDDFVNGFDEECDGTDDSSCPGLCGGPNSSFPCLCLNKKRQRVIEHANADSDDGWTGISHDRYLVEGGGYLSDLYDCDGPSGPDTLCTVGPSCTITRCQGGLNAGTACTADSECPGGRCAGAVCSNDTQCGVDGPCRKERTADGPHCNLDIQIACDNDADCTGGYAANNYCLKTFHGPPLPLSAGGVSVCVKNVFTEDVIGTVDLASGSASMRYHQDTITYFGPTAKRPCPTCGGFCNAPPTGDRRPCTTDADCVEVAGSPPCVTEPICSFGSNVDKPCRPDFPYGATNPLFGTTSLDCLPNSALVANLDLTFPNRSTGTVTLLPGIQCDDLAFGNKVCIGGTNNGRACVLCNGGANNGAVCWVNSQCPGGACNGSLACPGGTCSHQCFCPGGGATKQRPNGCDAACLGGGNDGNACAVDSQCPLGFCHRADCRLDESAIVCMGGPNNNSQCTVDSECPSGSCLILHEGLCSAGPLESICSFNHERSCNIDTDCQQPACPDCETDPLETCVTTFLNCFENTGIIRTGMADPENPTTAAAECSTAAISSAVNSTSGLPGPTTNRFPETRVNTGF